MDSMAYDLFSFHSGHMAYGCHDMWWTVIVSAVYEESNVVQQVISHRLWQAALCFQQLSLAIHIVCIGCIVH